MKRNWREVAKGDVAPQSAGMRASLNPKGIIRLSQTTHRRMGEPEAVHILFDEANNTIGLKPVMPSVRNAYRLLRRGRGRRELYALKLVNEAGLIVPETVEFPHIEIDLDGILVLDLRRTRVSAYARRRRARAIGSSRRPDPDSRSMTVGSVPHFVR
jgi:hypothetical protein